MLLQCKYTAMHSQNDPNANIFSEEDRTAHIQYMATDESARVEFKLRCNETAIKPQITFEKSFIGIEGSPDEYIFHVQTRNVCLRPTVTCEASRSYLQWRPIQMRVFHSNESCQLAPILSLLPLFLGGRKEA